MADKATELKKVLNSLDPDRLTQEDFAAAFNVVLGFIAEQDEENKAAFEEMKNFVELARQSLSDTSNDSHTQLHKSASDFQTTLQKIVNAKLKEIDEKLVNVRDGADADPIQIVQDVLAQIKLPEYRAPMMDGPEEIRDKLELLQEDERLDASAIKGLEKFVKDHAPKQPGGGTTGLIGRGRVHSYDLSDQLDGVTKIFSIPAVWAVISVAASSSPGALRAGIDYTVDYSAFTITFTDAIDVSVLEAGQNVIMIVEDA